MARHVEGKARAGSQKWLQVLVNDHYELLNAYIAPKLRPQPSNIEWLSPLRADCYAEYSDEDFIDRLGIKLDKKPRSEFWPMGGPHWDGLARTDKEQILLLEAKSHTKELVSTLGASSHRSISLISLSLNKTKKFVGSSSDKSVDWTVGVYQYANRLAHLYFLNKLNGFDAYLILLYFLKDKEREAGDTHVPRTELEWESVITYQERLMGIRQRHQLSDRIIHVFIDVNDIEARS